MDPDALLVRDPGGTDVSEHLAVLRRISAQMTATADIRGVLDSIVESLVEHAGVSTARVWLWTTEDQCEICRTHGPVGEFRGGDAPKLHMCATAAGVVTGAAAELAGLWHQLPAGFGLPGHVAASRTAYHSTDVMRDPHGPVELLRRYYAEHGFRSFIGYPLLFRGELLGVLGGLARRELTRAEFEHLTVFANQAAMAIQAARMMAALEAHGERLRVENEYLLAESREERGFDEVVGRSPALRRVLHQVRQVAGADSTVLLLGETGTGKELIARAIHALSPRRERPLIKVNCAAISPNLVESELFGHERGAFTGALQRRVGRFELANRGTLFLDEVGELPPEIQVKLLRVLQEQEFERVGGTQTLRTDVRVVAATNRALDREVAAGSFRADLYYRLNVFPIQIPPLRERATDIPLLVEHFLAQLQRKLAKPLRGVTEASIWRLQQYSWPGNIRELQNVLERACVLATSPAVEIPDVLVSSGSIGAASTGVIQTLEDAERDHIRRALRATGGVVHGPSGAARVLGLHPNTLRSRMDKLGIDKNVLR